MSFIVSQKIITIIVCDLALTVVYSFFVYRNSIMLNDSIFSLISFIFISCLFVITMLVITTSIDEMFDKAQDAKDSKRPKSYTVKYK